MDSRAKCIEFLTRCRDLRGAAAGITTTSTHPVYSQDRSAFVPVGSLAIGERVRTADGWALVETLTRERGDGQTVCNLEVEKDHTFLVGELGLVSHNDSAVGGRGGCAVGSRGGTYVLTHPVSGQVMRTGRTGNLSRREAQHARDPVLSRFDFEPVHRTDAYSQQRGLEQWLHDTYNPPLNRIRPISPINPNRGRFLDAAQQFLQGGNP